MMKRQAALALAATLSFAVHAQAAELVKVGLSGSFTGGSSSMGVAMRDGAKLAAAALDVADYAYVLENGRIML